MLVPDQIKIRRYYKNSPTHGVWILELPQLGLVLSRGPEGDWAVAGVFVERPRSRDEFLILEWWNYYTAWIQPGHRHSRSNT